MERSETSVFVIVMLCALAGTVLAVVSFGERVYVARMMIEAGSFLPLAIWSFGLRIGLWR